MYALEKTGLFFLLHHVCARKPPSLPTPFIRSAGDEAEETETREGKNRYEDMVWFGRDIRICEFQARKKIKYCAPPLNKKTPDPKNPIVCS